MFRKLRRLGGEFTRVCQAAPHHRTRPEMVARSLASDNTETWTQGGMKRMPQALMDRILTSPSLPSVPAVALKVLELTQQDDVSVDELAKVIQNDPALTAKLLQTANSPLFGLARKVSSIQQATVILGLRTVKVMALSFSLVDAMHGERSDGFNYEKYWRRSLTTAVVSRLLAEHCGSVRADECFVGGLLGDLGILAAHQCAAESYGQVLASLAVNPRPVQEIEKEVLGITHRPDQRGDAGVSGPCRRCCATRSKATMAMEWTNWETVPACLPRSCTRGSRIAELFCGDVEGWRHDEVKIACVELLSIPVTNIEQILDDVHTNVSDMASLFKIEIGESISYETLRAQAMMQMANLSMAAEMDRAAATNRVEEVQQELQVVSKKACTDGPDSDS